MAAGGGGHPLGFSPQPRDDWAPGRGRAGGPARGAAAAGRPAGAAAPPASPARPQPPAGRHQGREGLRGRHARQRPEVVGHGSRSGTRRGLAVADAAAEAVHPPLVVVVAGPRGARQELQVWVPPGAHATLDGRFLIEWYRRSRVCLPGREVISPNIASLLNIGIVAYTLTGRGLGGPQGVASDAGGRGPGRTGRASGTHPRTCRSPFWRTGRREAPWGLQRRRPPPKP